MDPDPRPVVVIGGARYRLGLDASLSADPPGVRRPGAVRDPGPASVLRRPRSGATAGHDDDDGRRPADADPAGVQGARSVRDRRAAPVVQGARSDPASGPGLSDVFGPYGGPVDPGASSRPDDDRLSPLHDDLARLELVIDGARTYLNSALDIIFDSRPDHIDTGHLRTFLDAARELIDDGLDIVDRGNRVIDVGESPDPD